MTERVSDARDLERAREWLRGLEDGAIWDDVVVTDDDSDEDVEARTLAALLGRVRAEERAATLEEAAALVLAIHRSAEQDDCCSPGAADALRERARAGQVGETERAEPPHESGR
jgi:hypothetical protein